MTPPLKGMRSERSTLAVFKDSPLTAYTFRPRKDYLTKENTACKTYETRNAPTRNK